MLNCVYVYVRYVYIYIYIYVCHNYACIRVKNAKSSAELTIWLIKCWSDNIRTCINMHINIQVHTYGKCAIFRWATLIRRYKIVWFAYHTYVYVYAYVYVYKYTRICAYVYGLQPMCNSTCKFWSLPLCCTYHLLQCWICIYVYVYIYIYIRVNTCDEYEACRRANRRTTLWYDVPLCQEHFL